MFRAIVRSRRRLRGSRRHRWLRFETLEDRRLLTSELGLDEPAAGAPPKSLADLPAAAQYAISAAIGQHQDAYHASAGATGWTLANPGQGFTAQVQSGVVQITSGADRWQMSLEGLGYGGTFQTVAAAQCAAHSNRLACDYGVIEEWYVNGPGGLQQGFTVAPLPQADAAGAAASLTVELGLGGDLTATVSAAGDGLTLARPDGSTALSYTGLVAYDATGRTLPAWLEVRPDGADQDLLIHVDAAGAQGAITIDPFIQQAKLTSSDGGALSRIAISGDTVVAADGFGGYVFIKPSSGWEDMTQVAKLTATDPGGTFGISVAIDLDTIVIGDSYAPGASGQPGAAWVYVKPSTGWADMTQTAKLTASDPVDVDRFGWSVGIDGDAIVVGASSKTIGGQWNIGATYVFEKPAAGWTDMTQTAKLTASTGAPFARLGYSVGISGDTVVAGTFGGGAYVFVKPAAGWADASETARLTASDSLNFSTPVGIDGQTIVVGSRDVHALNVFVKPAAGWAPATETARLTGSDGALSLSALGSLAISGDKILAGGSAASAYLFVKPIAGWVSMTETAKLTNADGASTIGVAIDGDIPVVATGGAAYVFGALLPPVIWTNPQGGDWHTASNWSTNAVPGRIDEVIIDTASDATITVQPGDDLAVRKLAVGPHDTLAINHGSLKVYDSSTIDGPLVIAGGTLKASTATAAVTVNGPASVADASLAAEFEATLSLPNLTSITGSTELTVGNGASVDLGGTVVSLPKAGAGGTVNVPELPAGVSVKLANAASLTDTTIHVAQGEMVALTGGTYAGNTTFNVAEGAALELTGAKSVTYTGTLSGSGAGAIRLSRGTLIASGTALTLQLPSSMFRWTGGKLSAATGTSVQLVDVNCSANAAMVIAQNARIELLGGSYTGGMMFNVAQGGAADISGGASGLTAAGMLAGSGAGTVELSSGQFVLGAGGVTLSFPGTMLQWTGGSFDSSLGDIINVGTVTLSGSNDKGFSEEGTLDNFGTINQAGSGDLLLGSDGTRPTTLKIEPGAAYLIQSDSGISAPGPRISAVVNEGTIAKTAGLGSSTFFVNGQLSNTGIIAADSGTLQLDVTSVSQIAGTTLTAGTWKASGGGTLGLPAGTAVTINDASIHLDGAGAITGIAGLTTNRGDFTLAGYADFAAAGDFTNSGRLTLGPGSTLSAAGNYAQTSDATLSIQVGGAPPTGLFGRIAATGSAALAGTFRAKLTNGFNPTAGQVFPVMAFANATGDFDTLDGLAPFFTASWGAASFDLNAVSDGVDLVLSGATAPASAAQGESITVQWQVENPGLRAAVGNWRDRVYLSASPEITSESVLLGTVEHEGGLPAGGSYQASVSTAVPAVAPGFWHVIVQADSHHDALDADRSNNTRPADSGPIGVAMTALTLGTPQSGSFTAGNQDRYYQVTVPAGGTLEVSLTSTAATGAVALYVSQVTLPTPYTYWAASPAPGKPNPAVTIQVLSPGTYYILAHSISGAAATSPYTLTATQTAAIDVSGISPRFGGNAGKVTVRIDGVNFTPSATARLTLGAATIVAQAVIFESSSRIYAAFDLGGATTGNYTLSVEQGGQSVTAATPFAVVSANPADLEVTLDVPQFIRSGRTGKIIVGYRNNTANDLMAPLLTISSTNPYMSFSLPDSPADFTTWATVLGVAPDGPAGVLRPGQGGQITLTMLSNDTIVPDEVPILLSQIEPGQTIDWASQKDELRPATTPPEAWDRIWSNLLSSVGNTTNSYHAALAADASYLSQFGPPVTNAATLFWFELEKANAAYTPQGAMTVAADVMPAPGMTLGFVQSFQPTISGRFFQGMLGAGWASNWDLRARTLADGNAALQLGKETSYHFRQLDGSFRNAYGDHVVLTYAGGAYRVQFTDGRVFQFNTAGKIAYVEDSNGNRITAGYNAAGQLKTLTHTNGSSMTLAYNAQGRLATLTDSTGRSVSYGYDPTGQWLTSFTDPSGTVNYSYVTDDSAARNALSEIAYPDNSRLYFHYDTRGRLAEQHLDGDAERQTFAYRAPGGYTITDANAHTSTVFYGLYGTLGQLTDPLGNVSRYYYDADLNLTEVRDALGARTFFNYDLDGNLVQKTDPLGFATAFIYDGQRNLTSYTDTKGNQTAYAYDAKRNLLSITYADGTKQQFTHNSLGQATQYLNARGHAIGLSYNAQGLVTQESFADGTSYGYAYDARGRLTSATTAAGQVTSFKYDAPGHPDLLSEVDYPDGTFLKFTYNAVGQRTRSVDQAGFTVNYLYDALGRLEGVTDAGGNLVVQYTYDPAGRMVQKDLGNGTRTLYAYDAADQVLSITNYAPDHATVNSFNQYSYDAAGNPLTDASQDGTWTYMYDAAGQLTRAVFASSDPAVLSNQDLAYVYDAAGNRISQTVNGLTTVYAVNSLNQYTSSTVGGAKTSYYYDADGNIAAMSEAVGTTRYTFNDLDQLLGISGPGLATSYAYDPLGNRIAQTIRGVTTRYQVDPAGLGNLVAAFDGSGNLLAHYTYAGGLVSQTTAVGDALYYDFNALGSTVGLTGAAGQYVNRYAYLPFGQTMTLAGAATNPFTFVGQGGVANDAGPLLAMRARWYDPATGQFVSRDPLGLMAGDPNLRRYVGNAPTQGTDPTGLSTQLSDEQMIDKLYRELGVNEAIERDSKIQELKGRLLEMLKRARAILNRRDEVKKRDPNIQEVELPDYGNLWDDIQEAELDYHMRMNRHLRDYKIYEYKEQNKKDRTVKTKTKPKEEKKSTNLSSHDPNAMVGPAGYGPEGFIEPGSVWSYTAEFENIGTVAAQDVIVTHQLDANLDWSTFQLGSVAFGTIDNAIPPGLSQYRTKISYRNVDGSPLNVSVCLDFNVETGLLTATFRSLDPNTGQAPEGVFDGFLPPNNASHIGEGWVQYTIQPKTSLTTGVAINQQASIVFDINDPLNTPVFTNTIDAGEPTSHVLPLPPTQANPSFLVTWSGQDDTGGSGVASYDVYVSDDGGPYSIWLEETPLTSETYVGQDKHAYKFYSLAMDNVGHRQTTPAAPASTVVGNVWHNYANPYDVDDLDGVKPQDVLLIINWINGHPSDSTPPAPPAIGPPYYDVDDDGAIWPQDVLLVVNYINAHPSGAGEGEAGLGMVLTPPASPATVRPISPGGRAPSPGGVPDVGVNGGQSGGVVLGEIQAARQSAQEAATGSTAAHPQWRVRADEFWDGWDAELDPLEDILLDLAPAPLVQR